MLKEKFEAWDANAEFQIVFRSQWDALPQKKKEEGGTTVVRRRPRGLNP